MKVKATKLKRGGAFQVQGLEAFAKDIENRVMGALEKLRKGGKKQPAGADTLSQLLQRFKKHPQRKALVNAGKAQGQLMRSLVPLYLGRGLEVAITSGITSKFWADAGVTFAAPNAAKALREHPGYAKRTKKGPVITAKGVEYVEGALNGAKGR